MSENKDRGGFAFVDRETYEPCPTRGALLCTIADSGHLHMGGTHGPEGACGRSARIGRGQPVTRPTLADVAGDILAQCETEGHYVPGDPRHPAWMPVCRRCRKNLEEP